MFSQLTYQIWTNNGHVYCTEHLRFVLTPDSLLCTWYAKNTNSTFGHTVDALHALFKVDIYFPHEVANPVL